LIQVRFLAAGPVLGADMSDGGKGSSQRPTDKKKYDENYDKIFGKKKKEEKK
jgi:hypothetical protein